MVLIEDFEEFSAKHGGDPVRFQGNWWLFPDGASCDDNFAIRRQPPHDSAERIKLRREYVEAKLKLAERDFRDLKNEALEQAQLAITNSNLPAPPNGVPKELNRRKEIVQTLREQLAGIEEEYAQTPEAQRRRQREAELQERRTAIVGLMSEIETIEI